MTSLCCHVEHHHVSRAFSFYLLYKLDFLPHDSYSSSILIPCILLQMFYREKSVLQQFNANFGTKLLPLTNVIVKWVSYLTGRLFISGSMSFDCTSIGFSLSDYSASVACSSIHYTVKEQDQYGYLQLNFIYRIHMWVGTWIQLLNNELLVDHVMWQCIYLLVS